MTYEQTLLELTTKNSNIIVMTAENRAAIRNLEENLGDRFLDFGICEQTMIGAAAGLALRGRIPIVHALATFLTMRAFEFIRTDVGIGNLPVKLVGGIPGFLSEANGPTHQALEDIALMRGIPGMEIFCPADEEELIEGLPEVIKRPNPCYIRFNASKAEVQHVRPFRFGQAEILAQGNDVSVFSFGTLLKEAARTVQIIAAQGKSVRFVNLRTLKPIDEDTIVRAARETKLIVTIEDHFQTGGLFSIVSEILLKRRIQCPVFSIAMEDHWFQPALLPEVLVYEGFSGKEMATNILETFKLIYK